MKSQRKKVAYAYGNPSKKEKTHKTNEKVREKLVSNIVLGVLVVAVGAVCSFPADREVVADVKGVIYRRAERVSDGVSLMFNVYQGENYVMEILDTLDEYGAKATFFIGGCWADDHTQCVKEILLRGNEIGNHGFFHKDQDKLDEKENLNEISSCNRFLQLVTGVEPVLFAPPSGAYNQATLDAVEKLNMKTILWSRDTVDWRDQNESLIYTRATDGIAGGEFVLMHPTKCTALALGKILDTYKNNGLRAITVSENLQSGG